MINNEREWERCKGLETCNSSLHLPASSESLTSLHTYHTQWGVENKLIFLKEQSYTSWYLAVVPPFFCVLFSSPYIRLRSEDSIHQVFWSHPPNRKQAFSSLSIIIIFIDFPCQSKVTNLDYPRTRIVFHRYKAVPSCKIPIVEVTVDSGKQHSRNHTSNARQSGKKGDIWRLTSVDNLTGFRTTQETDLWACLWGSFPYG